MSQQFPKITLRNVQYAAFASEETSCFQATVYVDGKRFCIASNEGHGGPDRYDPLKGETRDALNKKIAEVARRANPDAVAHHDDATAEIDIDDDDWFLKGKHTEGTVFECLVGRALTRALVARDLTRSLKTKIIATTESGRLYEWKVRKGVDKSAAVAQIMKQQQEKGDPVAQCLNMLTLERAVDAVLAIS